MTADFSDLDMTMSCSKRVDVSVVIGGQVLAEKPEMVLLCGSETTLSFFHQRRY